MAWIDFVVKFIACWAASCTVKPRMMAPDKTDVKISPVPVAFTGIRGTEYVVTVSVEPSYTAIVASVSEGTLVIMTSSGPI